MKKFINIPRIIYVVILIASQSLSAKSMISLPWQPAEQIQVTTTLSQTKLVQKGANTVFLDVTFKPPAIRPILERKRASDVIIVLDRSGSMSEAKKMPFAKAAIWDVLGRLHDDDRFALVSFADNAIVQSPLVKVSTATRRYLNNVVRSISASGGTNMGDGLNAAIGLLENKYGERNTRAVKILLLSDGQANQGITNPEQLAQIAARVTHYGAVLSSIGMGLGFNENLMAKLADYGMGHYSYLEDLSGLGTILARDLEETRQIYASSSSLQLNLADGVQLVDAGGYPMTYLGSSTISISTGQMLSNTQKHFVMTFNVPTANIGTFSLGTLHLNYLAHGQELQTQVNPQSLKLAVVAPEYRIQAQQSIDKNVYQNSWAKNNLARMQKRLSKWMREGKKEKAKNAINDYRKEVEIASKVSNLRLVTPEVEGKLEEMEKEVDNAFIGSMLDQEVKRNRAAKSMQFDSIESQRK